MSEWYGALAKQLDGLYYKDGGPVIMAQVDNETPDWRYLLALKQLATSQGIDPTYFTKTGWPAPAPFYPSDYPMLPFFGGYADQFWTNAMSAQPISGGYLFAATGEAGVPKGYPYLGVEIGEAKRYVSELNLEAAGGGMAAAYNHRTHM